MWAYSMNQCLCLIVMLLFGLLNASNPTVISSSNAPTPASLDDVDGLVSSPLTEDNFTSVFPIVCTFDGCVEGRATPGFQIDEYESFFGIPYAEPPIGKLRFAVRILSLSLFVILVVYHSWLLCMHLPFTQQVQFSQHELCLIKKIYRIS